MHRTRSSRSAKMARVEIIADTGVLVGLLRKRDQWNQWATGEADCLEPPFLTCEAVISESCFLLRDVVGGGAIILGLLSDGFLKLSFSLDNEIESINMLMRKYEDVPMSLADACLLRMSELIDNSAVFTVDRDFLIYRKHSRAKVPLISPF